MTKKKYAQISSPSPQFNPISNRDFRAIEIIASDFKITRLRPNVVDASTVFVASREQTQISHSTPRGKFTIHTNTKPDFHQCVRLDQVRMRSKQ